MLCSAAVCASLFDEQSSGHQIGTALRRLSLGPSPEYTVMAHHDVEPSADV
jgi:hypothetical protein